MYVHVRECVRACACTCVCVLRRGKRTHEDLKGFAHTKSIAISEQPNPPPGKSPLPALAKTPAASPVTTAPHRPPLNMLAKVCICCGILQQEYFREKWRRVEQWRTEWWIVADDGRCRVLRWLYHLILRQSVILRANCDFTGNLSY